MKFKCIVNNCVYNCLNKNLEWVTDRTSEITSLENRIPNQSYFMNLINFHSSASNVEMNGKEQNLGIPSSVWQNSLITEKMY